MARLLTKDLYPKVLDAGERSTKPGRKFNYSDEDFIESYLGKDGNRLAFAEGNELKDDYSSAFGFNETLKNKYPLKNYLSHPKLEEKKKQLNELADIHGEKNKEFQEKFDLEEKMARINKDTPHPTDPKRTFYSDLQKRIEDHIKHQHKKDLGDIVDAGEIYNQGNTLRKEYFPKEKKPTRYRRRRTAAKSEIEEVKEIGLKDIGQTEKFEPAYEDEIEELSKEMRSN